MFTIVMNPLTEKQVRLPCLGMDDVLPAVLPSMVQLIMDSEKQHYKVFAAGDRNMDSGDTEFSNKCMIPGPRSGWMWGQDIISHGTVYDWDFEGTYYDDSREDLCVYDFAEGQLQDFGWCGCNVEGPFEVLKNRVFVGYKQARAGPSNLDVPDNDSGLAPKFCILEYQLQGNVWVKVQTHDCPLDGKRSEKFRG